MTFKIKEQLKGCLIFLKEIIAQIGKINWPSARESLKYTFIVLFISVILAVFLGGIDFGLTVLLNKLILK